MFFLRSSTLFGGMVCPWVAVIKKRAIRDRRKASLSLRKSCLRVIAKGVGMVHLAVLFHLFVGWKKQLSSEPGKSMVWGLRGSTGPFRTAVFPNGYALCSWPLLVPRGRHLGGLVPPFWHPGGLFWHLGNTPWRTMEAAGWSGGGPAQHVH